MTQIVRSTRDNTVQLVVESGGRYVVTVSGKSIFSSRVLTAAEIYYNEEVDKQRAAGRALLRREKAEFDARALEFEAWQSKSSRARFKGGKGGKGGV